MKPTHLLRPRSISRWITGAVLATAAAAAPQPPQSDNLNIEMYTRVEDGVLRAAVQFEIADGYHIYDTFLSDPDAAAIPTVFAFEGDGLTWGQVVMPRPKLVTDALGAMVEEHVGTIVAYVAASVGEGADPASASITVAGQICDATFCTQFGETLSSAGSGTDAMFANFPAKALPAGVAAPSADRADQDEAEQHAADQNSAQGTVFDWEPDFSSSNAEARLVITTDFEQVEARIQIAVDEGYHIFHGPTAEDFGPEDASGWPTTVEFESSGIEWGPTRYPEPHEYVDALETTVLVHEGNLELVVRGVLGPDADVYNIVAKVGGQICNEEGCIFLDEDDFTLEADEVIEVDALEPLGVSPAEKSAKGASVQPLPDSPAGSGAGGDEEKPLYLFLLEAILWGFITLLMPCTYPMIPITISFFTKQAHDRDGAVLPLSLAYGAGIVAIFVLIGVVVGPVIVEWAVHPVFNLFIAILFVVFALSLFGWINLQPPAFLMRASGKASTKGGYAGVFLMGLTLVVTSFTCTAPFVGTLLARGATSGAGGNDLVRIVLGMGLFGLTMATPFVFLSLFPSRVQKMPSAGAWMNTLKVFLGFVEIAASLKFLSNVDLAWDWEFLSKEVFLVLWGGIFLVAALFLFGKINLKGEEDGKIGPGRMVGGLATFLFSVYCFFLIFGFKMDPLMVAFAPPYSSAPEIQISGISAGGGGEHYEPGPYPIVKDDHGFALSDAIDKEKLVMINFTGVY